MSMPLEKLKSESVGLNQRALNKTNGKDMATWKKMMSFLLFLSATFAMGFVNIYAEKDLEYFAGILLSVSFLYFLFKMILSFFYKPVLEEAPEGIKVSVVIPSYNEDPQAVKQTIECMMEQDYPVHEIIFVDDGSPDQSAYLEVQKIAKEVSRYRQEVAAAGDGSTFQWNSIPNIIVHRLKKNSGKRAAQAWGFKRATGDMLMIVDSDGYVFPDAVRELLKPFKDPEVLEVVGHINARNVNDGFITKLQDIMYESAFRVGRGSQSVTNSVLVCSGALSMLRANFVMDNLDEFENQMFFGKRTDIGDDRWLTTMALREGGKTKYQSTARCITDVPTSLNVFFKQQVRWSRSFYFYTILSLKFAWKNPLMLLWLLGEGTIWAIFGATSVVSWLTRPESLMLLLAVYSAAYLVLSALAHNVYYIIKNPLLYLLSPIFALAHMALLYPIRIYSLLTINNNGWGTR